MLLESFEFYCRSIDSTGTPGYGINGINYGINGFCTGRLLGMVKKEKSMSINTYWHSRTTLLASVDWAFRLGHLAHDLARLDLQLGMRRTILPRCVA